MISLRETIISGEDATINNQYTTFLPLLQAQQIELAKPIFSCINSSFSKKKEQKIKEQMTKHKT